MYQVGAGNLSGRGTGMYQVGARRAVPLLINPGRGGDVLEQVVGDAPGRRQLVGKVGGRGGLLQEFPHDMVAVADEAEGLDGGGRAEPAELIEGAHGFVEKEREEVAGGRRVRLLV